MALKHIVDAINIALVVDTQCCRINKESMVYAMRQIEEAMVFGGVTNAVLIQIVEEMTSLAHQTIGQQEAWYTVTKEAKANVLKVANSSNETKNVLTSGNDIFLPSSSYLARVVTNIKEKSSMLLKTDYLRIFVL